MRRTQRHRRRVRPRRHPRLLLDHPLSNLCNVTEEVQKYSIETDLATSVQLEVAPFDSIIIAPLQLRPSGNSCFLCRLDRFCPGAHDSLMTQK